VQGHFFQDWLLQPTDYNWRLLASEGGKLRAVLAARTGARTIPQVFIGGTHVGGATEMFDAWRSGKARELLAHRGVAFDAGVELDPYSLLPKWLQPRKSA